MNTATHSSFVSWKTLVISNKVVLVYQSICLVRPLIILFNSKKFLSCSAITHSRVFNTSGNNKSTIKFFITFLKIGTTLIIFKSSGTSDVFIDCIIMPIRFLVISSLQFLNIPLLYLSGSTYLELFSFFFYIIIVYLFDAEHDLGSQGRSPY